MDLKYSYPVDKNDIAVKKIYEVIMHEYNIGRTTALSNEEMKQLVKEYLPKYSESEFERLKKKAGNLALHIVDELSESDMIRTMDPDTLEKVMEEIRNDHDFIQFVYVVDRKGIKITRNIIDPKFSKSYEKKDVGVIYSDREWFSQPIRYGLPFVSDFYISRVTDRLCITVSAPIRDQDDKIVGVIGMDISFQDVANI